MSEPVEQETLPAIFDYCAQVYQAMQEEASYEALGAAYGDEEGLVYDGFTTKLIREMGLPTPYYTKVFQELQRMDCCRQLRRGGSSTTSRWLLLQAPTPELFTKMQADRKPKGGKASMQQQISDLNVRVGRLEEALGLS